jgi:membrane protein insertase Oxa1/YidC/SpoIIIJ
MNTDEPEHRILVQQNIDLRRKLEEENQNYKRKLSNYQEGQQKQAQLVQKLQQKVNLKHVSRRLSMYFNFIRLTRLYNIKVVVQN